jgi:cell division septation protein DedD
LDTACRGTLRNADAMTIARSNRDAVLARLTPAQRADALASRSQPAQPATPITPNGAARQIDGQVTATALPTTSGSETPSTVPVAVRPMDYRVQIGSLPSLAEAQAEWHRLQQKLPDLLGKRSGNVDDVTISGIGTRYRLTTGPFIDRHAAKEFCAALKSAGQNCLISQPPTN